MNCRNFSLESRIGIIIAMMGLPVADYLWLPWSKEIHDFKTYTKLGLYAGMIGMQVVISFLANLTRKADLD